MGAINPPPHCIVIACARWYPRTPEGTYPNRCFPRLPITVQRTLDTKQDMQTQGHMKHKMSQKLPSGINVDRETGSVCHFF